MDLKEIKELIGVMRKHKIKEIDLDQEGSKVRIVAQDATPATRTEVVTVPSGPAPPGYYASPPAEAAPAAPPAPSPSLPAVAETPVAASAPEAPAGTEIKSPMVGTFYRAPAPDAPPYAEVGAVVNEDSVLCIIEAMKLMNEIKAEMRGKIVRALVENGQPVEFGQPLFLVEPL